MPSRRRESRKPEPTPTRSGARTWWGHRRGRWAPSEPPRGVPEIRATLAEPLLRSRPIRMKRRTARPVALLTVAALLAAACSGGGDDDTADPSPAASTAADDETDDAPAAVDVEVLEASTPQVTAPDADLRCERMGYPCSWSDIEPAAFDATVGLASEITAIVDGAPDPVAGLDAAVARLAEEPDLVELVVDREGFTGLMYRLDGQPPAYALTSLAAPLGELGDVELAAPPAASPDEAADGEPAPNDPATSEPATGEPATSAAGEPQGFRSVQLRPEAYRPAGGP